MVFDAESNERQSAACLRQIAITVSRLFNSRLLSKGLCCNFGQRRLVA